MDSAIDFPSTASTRDMIGPRTIPTLVAAEDSLAAYHAQSFIGERRVMHLHVCQSTL